MTPISASDPGFYELGEPVGRNQLGSDSKHLTQIAKLWRSMTAPDLLCRLRSSTAASMRLLESVPWSSVCRQETPSKSVRKSIGFKLHRPEILYGKYKRRRHFAKKSLWRLTIGGCAKRSRQPMTRCWLRGLGDRCLF